MSQAFDPFSYRLCTIEDVAVVSSLFAETFAEREAVQSFIGINVDKARKLFATPITTRCLNESLSFVCEDTASNEIVAFVLCETFKKPKTIESLDEQSLAFVCLINSIKNKWIALHPEYSMKDEQLKQIFYITAVGVKRGYENRGIASHLIELAMDNAEKQSLELAVTLATGLQSQHIFDKKLGFKEMNSVVYENYEFNRKHYFVGLKEPPKLIVYELSLQEWKAKSSAN